MRKITIIAFLMIVGILIGVSQFPNTFWGYWNEFVLNNRDHFASCDELPTINQVSTVLNIHQRLVEQIEAINPEKVFVSMGTSPFHYVNQVVECPGKADLLITYVSSEDKTAIEKILRLEEFSILPYRMRNR